MSCSTGPLHSRAMEASRMVTPRGALRARRSFGLLRSSLLLIGAVLVLLNMMVETPAAFAHLKVIKWIVNQKYRTYMRRRFEREKHLTNPERHKFRVGDRVRLKMPMAINHKGRGYFNEGRARMLKHFYRNHEEEIQDAATRERHIDGGAEGWVAYYQFQYFGWGNRPSYFKGTPRPLAIVSFDDPNIPICAVEEVNLELMDRSMAEVRMSHGRWVRKQRKLDNEWRDPYSDILMFKAEGGEKAPFLPEKPARRF